MRWRRDRNDEGARRTQDEEEDAKSGRAGCLLDGCCLASCLLDLTVVAALTVGAAAVTAAAVRSLAA